MKTTRTIQAGGKTLQVRAGGTLAHGGLSVADAGRVFFRMRSGYDTARVIADADGLSPRKVQTFLKTLEREGKAWWDYGCNGWKLNEAALVGLV